MATCKYEGLHGSYIVRETIGFRPFGKVKRGTHLGTSEQVSINVVKKDFLGQEAFVTHSELKALKTLCHPHIVKLYQVSQVGMNHHNPANLLIHNVSRCIDTVLILIVIVF